MTKRVKLKLNYIKIKIKLKLKLVFDVSIGRSGNRLANICPIRSSDKEGEEVLKIKRPSTSHVVNI